MMTVLFVECCVFSMEQKILLHNVGVLFIEDLIVLKQSAIFDAMFGLLFK